MMEKEIPESASLTSEPIIKNNTACYCVQYYWQCFNWGKCALLSGKINVQVLMVNCDKIIKVNCLAMFSI